MERPSYDPNAIHPSLVPSQLLEAVQFALGKLADERPEDPIAYFAQCLLDTTPERRAALAKAAAEDAQRQQELLAAAQKKFRELDSNGNGVLEGDELVELGKWVLTEFESASGLPLGKRAQAELGEKLLKRIDANDDQTMDFNEFKGWFEKILQQIGRYRRHAADRRKWVYRASIANEVKGFAASEKCTFEQARTIMANNQSYQRFIFANVKSHGGRRPNVPVQVYFLTADHPVPSAAELAAARRGPGGDKKTEAAADRYNSRAARKQPQSKAPVLWHCWIPEKPPMLTSEDIAAIKIQRVARGHVQRRKFKQEKDAAVQIQKQLRGHITRKQLKYQAIQGMSKQNLLLEGVYAIDGVEFLVLAEVVTSTGKPFWQFSIYDRGTKKKQLEHIFLPVEFEELKEHLHSIQDPTDAEQRKVLAVELLKLFKVEMTEHDDDIVTHVLYDGPASSHIDSLSQFSSLAQQSSPRTPASIGKLPLPLPLPTGTPLDTPLPAPRFDYDTLQRPITAGDKERFASPQPLTSDTDREALLESADDLPSRPRTAGDKEKPTSASVLALSAPPSARPHTAGEKEKPASPGSLMLGSQSPMPEIHHGVLVIRGSPLSDASPLFSSLPEPLGSTELSPSAESRDGTLPKPTALLPQPESAAQSQSAATAEPAIARPQAVPVTTSQAEPAAAAPAAQSTPSSARSRSSQKSVPAASAATETPAAPAPAEPAAPSSARSRSSQKSVPSVAAEQATPATESTTVATSQSKPSSARSRASQNSAAKEPAPAAAAAAPARPASGRSGSRSSGASKPE